MRAIFIKELNAYFSSLTGYLAIGLFLLVAGLLLFVFESDYNILDFGFADLTPFFQLVPYLFLFLIPAITMRSFSQERDLGTLEMLLTRPVSRSGLILGKYLAAFLVITVAIILTMIYVYSVYQMGDPEGNLDLGSTMGSYLGILMIAAVYVLIGLFASLASSNQIVSFLLAASISFFLFYGFEALAISLNQEWIAQLGILQHYETLARGILDTRDLVYFVVVGLFFFALSENLLNTITAKK
jgi:ABC-2 type transport system permease protein